jgi:predicted polyphosphate/ATP-dependent NAD kinase
VPLLGLVVNPIAGMGGRVALKGTDGPEALRIARERGASPVAPQRAARALARLAQEAPGVRMLAAPGPMGADLARDAGLDVETIGTLGAGDTSAADTRAAVAEMRGVDLLLFAGGDGTARDIHAAVGSELPMLGIPTGVKMHSGVFAASPAAAGAAAAAYLRAPALTDAEIADADEDRIRLHGAVRVPRQPRLLLGRKAGSDPSSVEALADAVDLRDGLTLVGPGTTTAAVLRHHGLEGTLLGVDAVRAGEVVARDLDEAGLLALLDAHDDAVLLVGVVGGQGALFGRGNQQLSPAVLRRVRIQVLATVDKLVRLDPPWLRVDTGDEALDAELSGYIRVHTGPGRTIVMKVAGPVEEFRYDHSSTNPST